MFDKANDMSITNAEFSYTENATTTITTPSKMIIGIPIECIHRSNTLYSGVSTQNTPISLRIGYASANANAHNLNCILAIDAVLTIDQGIVSMKI
jgi:hypothetical protein